MELLSNILHAMIDMNSATQHTDPTWFWVYESRERKRNNIIKGLL